jgi:hypothetical protein
MSLWFLCGKRKTPTIPLQEHSGGVVVVCDYFFAFLPLAAFF